MLKKAMEAINGLIDEQVRSRSCAPLRPDLDNFYDFIVQNTQNGQSEQDDTEMSNRRKRFDGIDAMDSSPYANAFGGGGDSVAMGDEGEENERTGGNDVRNSLDWAKINEKSRTVKKLLKEYEELPEEEQAKMAELKDDLMHDLIFLRQLKAAQIRHKREQLEQKELQMAMDNDAIMKRLQSQYSPEFLKLFKTSDLYREIVNGEQPIL